MDNEQMLDRLRVLWVKLYDSRRKTCKQITDEEKAGIREMATLYNTFVKKPTLKIAHCQLAHNLHMVGKLLHGAGIIEYKLARIG